MHIDACWIIETLANGHVQQMLLLLLFQLVLLLLLLSACTCLKFIQYLWIVSYDDSFSACFTSTPFRIVFTWFPAIRVFGFVFAFQQDLKSFHWHFSFRVHAFLAQMRVTMQMSEIQTHNHKRKEVTQSAITGESVHCWKSDCTKSKPNPW